jgi:hypothetical protein
MVAIQRRLYRQAFERLGPGAFRVGEDWLEGSVNLRDHAAPRARAKAAVYAQRAHRALPALRASKRYLPRENHAWIDEFAARLVAETGPLTRKERITSKLVPLLLWYTDFAMRHNIGQQPQSSRRVWRGSPAKRTAPAAQLEAEHPLAPGPT